MSLADELSERVAVIFREQWKKRDGYVVPESKDVELANEAVELGEATVLYADMADSTKLVDTCTWQFAAEVYKAFLYCAAHVIASEEGTVTAYDGDRVMAVFLGEYKNTSATRAALKINYCNHGIITPALKRVYKDSTYVARHVVGIDTSPLRVARTGVVVRMISSGLDEPPTTQLSCPRSRMSTRRASPLASTSDCRTISRRRKESPCGKR